MLFFIFQLLFVRSEEEIEFTNYKSNKRIIQLNLRGYCNDKINEVIVLDDKNKSTLSSFNYEKHGKDIFFSFEIPTTFKEDFYVVIVAKDKIIKIGSFSFKKDGNLSDSSSDKPVIMCRYTTSDNAVKIKKKIINSEKVEGRYGDNYTVVKCFSTEKELFLDLTGYVDDKEKIKKILIKDVYSIKNKELNKFEYPKKSDKIKVYDPSKKKEQNSDYILFINDLDDVEDYKIFFIVVQTNKNILKIGSFKRDEDGKLQGYKNNRVSIRETETSSEVDSNDKLDKILSKNKRIRKVSSSKKKNGGIMGFLMNNKITIFCSIAFLLIFVLLIAILINRK